ncbi:MAG: hypothetical protein Q9218_005650 [Villophora microphyllina]
MSRVARPPWLGDPAERPAIQSLDGDGGNTQLRRTRTTWTPCHTNDGGGHKTHRTNRDAQREPQADALDEDHEIDGRAARYHKTNHDAQHEPQHDPCKADKTNNPLIPRRRHRQHAAVAKHDSIRSVEQERQHIPHKPQGEQRCDDGLMPQHHGWEPNEDDAPLILRTGNTITQRPLTTTTKLPRKANGSDHEHDPHKEQHLLPSATRRCSATHRRRSGSPPKQASRERQFLGRWRSPNAITLEGRRYLALSV